MFKAIVEAGYLQQYVDALTAVDDEARINIERNGLRTAVVGPANVVMCRTMLGETAFESYEADERQLFALALTGTGKHKVSLDDALGFVDSDTLLELTFDGDGDRKLYITGDGYDFELATLDPESVRQEPDIPSADFPNRMVVEGGVLSSARDAAALASDHVTITGRPDEDAVEVSGSGDNDDVVKTLDVGDELLEGTEITAGVESMFAEGYLKKILKPVPSDTVVDAVFGHENPVKWSYEYAGAEGKVTNFIAPRIPE